MAPSGRRLHRSLLSVIACAASVIAVAACSSSGGSTSAGSAPAAGTGAGSSAAGSGSLTSLTVAYAANVRPTAYIISFG